MIAQLHSNNLLALPLASQLLLCWRCQKFITIDSQLDEDCVDFTLFWFLK